MIIRSATLKNFRTYDSETFTFHNRFNLISGENAQGKTNLLEALHFLCNFRGFKQVKLEELISLGKAEARIKGEIETEIGFNEVHILLRQQAKTVKLNGKVVYDMAKFAGKFSLVSFLPSDMELVKGAPQDRRRYLDGLICSFDIGHLADLKSYIRALKQRNAFLSATKNLSSEALDVWDEKIAEAGGRIVRRRVKLVKRLEPLLERNYRSISGGNLKVGFEYRPSFRSEGSLENGLNKGLKSRVEQDRKRGRTSVGPHRDVPGFVIEGRNASSFASQGEAKTLALALRVSELELIENVVKRTPALLLDDITSELDSRRRNFLFSLVEEFSGQVFVTTTDPGDVSYRGDKKVFQIKGGRAQVVT